MNCVVLAGRLGFDPEIKYFDSGTAKCRLRLATDRPSKEKKTDWHTIELWGKSAESAAEHLKKGSVIGIEGGRLEYQEFEKNGEKRSIPVVVANSWRYVGNKASGDAEPTGGNGYGKAPVMDGEEIPF